MDHISFFKLQAKRLHKDFKTKTKVYDEVVECDIYEFTPSFFDVDEIVVSYDLSDEEIENFSLMKAQHFIAQFVGFNKWNTLILANENELEMAMLLFDNQNKISKDYWDYYIQESEKMNQTIFDINAKIAIFKKVFLSEEGVIFESNDIRLKK